MFGFPGPSGPRAEGSTHSTDYEILKAHLCRSRGAGDRQGGQPGITKCPEWQFLMCCALRESSVSLCTTALHFPKPKRLFPFLRNLLNVNTSRGVGE